MREKYTRPIYGRACSIPSLNFDPVAWIKLEGGKALDPYKLLPKMFPDVSERDFERLSKDDELRDGGAAMNAYAKMQFEEMNQAQHQAIQAGLLRYCELDTLAMVMLYEAWRKELR